MFHAFLFAIIFNLIIFIPAFVFKTDKFTDISYSITFIAIVSYLFFKQNDQIYIVNFILYLMVCIWALRLGGYLLYRIQKIGRDKRFDTMHHNFFKFLKFWLLQGVTVFVVLIPSIFVLKQSNPAFQLLSILGVGWNLHFLRKLFKSHTITHCNNQPVIYFCFIALCQWSTVA